MTNLSWGSGPTQYVFSLTPDQVMDALEKFPILGEKRMCTGYCQALASFENRVYEVEFEEPFAAQTSTEGLNLPSKRHVVKFYRPGRWTREQILEEHQFMLDVIEAEVPAVIPHFFEKPADTLRESDDGLFFCIYPKVGGRQPEDLTKPQLEQLGRLIARMHTVGSQRKALHRIQLTPASYGKASLDFLLKDGCVSPQAEPRFEKIVREIVTISEDWFQGIPLQRIHGDCHAGNILWNEKLGPFFIDFDDMVVGPQIQDLWLLASDPEHMHDLVEGYLMMRDLPKGSVKLSESLRALRMIHYATWIAKRYEDPAFQRAFPQFESPKYWDDLTQDLERQLDRMIKTGEHYG